MNEYVEDKVSMPGMLLMVGGILSILGGLAALGYMGWVFIGGYYDINTVVGLAYGAASGLVGGAIIAYGGMQLKNLGSSGAVWAAIVLSLIPCCGPSSCCCLTGAFAVWAIMVMMDEQVQAAFA